MTFAPVAGFPGDPTNLGICIAALRSDLLSCTSDDLQSIVTAAGLAGFRNASLWPMHYQLAKAGGMRDADLLRWLDEAELSVLVIDSGREWASGISKALVDESNALIELAQLVGATHIGAVNLNETTFDRPRALAGLAAFADRAADAGLSVSIEWLPWTVLPTLSSVWELIESVDRANVGLVFDSWHWLRQPGGPQPDVLRTIPGERVHLLHLCDAPAQPDGPMLEETSRRRLLPGEGATDWHELARIFGEIDAHPIIAPEPFNTERASQGPSVYAHAIADATHGLLSSAESATRSSAGED